MQKALQNITPEIYQQLKNFRTEIAMFQTVACKLMHEQVLQVDVESIPADGDLSQLKVLRIGFCNSSNRRFWIGCAHTLANDKFTRLADQVYDTGILEHNFYPSIAINKLVMEIYALDHEKGRMEKRKALAEQQQNVAELSIVAKAMNEIISRHQTAVNELEQWRLAIIEQLDLTIANYVEER